MRNKRYIGAMTDAAVAEPRTNLLELTVSELSAQLKRTLEDAYGYVRVRGELGNVKYHSSGHVYLDLKDDRACIAGVVWRTTAARIKIKLEPGLEVVVTGRITTYPGQSKYQIVVDSLAPAGRRRLDGAVGRTQAQAYGRRPVRPGAQAAAAVPAARHRRDHLADRRRHPRHPASPCRPVSPARAGLAGARPGRRVGRADRGGDRRPQRAHRPRIDPASGSDHRGPRRRLARGSVVVQRGDRRARGGGEPHSADLGGRPRNRRHLARLRGRPARADTDGGGRNGGAGPQRAAGADRWAGAAQSRVLGANLRRPAQGAALRRARLADGRSAARRAAPADRYLGRTAAARLDRQCAHPSRQASARRRTAGGASAARAGAAIARKGHGVRRKGNACDRGRCSAAGAIASTPRQIASRPRCARTGPRMSPGWCGIAIVSRARSSAGAAPPRRRSIAAGPRSSAPRTCLPRCPITACWRAALRWCATMAGGRCARPRPSFRACGSTSSSPTAGFRRWRPGWARRPRP